MFARFARGSWRGAPRLVDEWKRCAWGTEGLCRNISAGCQPCVTFATEVHASEDVETIALSSTRWKARTSMKSTMSTSNAQTHSLRWFIRLSGDERCSLKTRVPFTPLAGHLQCFADHATSPWSASSGPVNCVVSQKALPIASALIFSICICISASEVHAAFHA